MNWQKILEGALKIGVALKTVSDVNQWIDEKIHQLQTGNEAAAYVEIAYELAELDNEQWQLIAGQIRYRSSSDRNAANLFNYCNYVIQVENNYIRELLSYSIQDATDLLSYNLRDMQVYEAAAHYGVLQAYAGRSMKARAVLGQFNRLLG